MRLLVCSQAPTREGAPIGLLRQMRALASDGRVEPIFLFRRRGELWTDFSTVGRTVLLSDLIERAGLRAGRATHGEPPVRAVQHRWLATWLARRCRRWRIDAVYVNSVLAWELAMAAGTLEVPAIWHLHESSRALERFAPPGALARTLPTMTRLVAVSHPVADALRANGADLERIAIVPGMVESGPNPSQWDAAAGVRQRLGVGGGGLVVGAGKPSDTKGSDLFVQLAVDLDTRRPGTRMCWVGLRDDAASRAMRDDSEKVGLRHRLELVPAVRDLVPYLAAADVLASTAREDSMPLTVLEAAAAGVPFVCFEGSGGAADLAAGGAGLAVEYLDVAAMSAAVTRLLADPDLRGETAARARDYVHEHCSKEAVVKGAMAVINDAVGA